MQEALKNIVDRAYVDMVFSVAENEIKDKKPLTYSVQVLENILKKLKDTQTDVSDLEARLSVIKAAIDKKD